MFTIVNTRRVVKVAASGVLTQSKRARKTEKKNEKKKKTSVAAALKIRLQAATWPKMRPKYELYAEHMIEFPKKKKKHKMHLLCVLEQQLLRAKSSTSL